MTRERLVPEDIKRAWSNWHYLGSDGPVPPVSEEFIAGYSEGRHDALDALKYEPNPGFYPGDWVETPDGARGSIEYLYLDERLAHLTDDTGRTEDWQTARLTRIEDPALGLARESKELSHD